MLLQSQNNQNQRLQKLNRKLQMQLSQLLHNLKLMLLPYLKQVTKHHKQNQLILQLHRLLQLLPLLMLTKHLLKFHLLTSGSEKQRMSWKVKNLEVKREDYNIYSNTYYTYLSINIQISPLEKQYRF